MVWYDPAPMLPRGNGIPQSALSITGNHIKQDLQYVADNYLDDLDPDLSMLMLHDTRRLRIYRKGVKLQLRYHTRLPHCIIHTCQVVFEAGTVVAREGLRCAAYGLRPTVYGLWSTYARHPETDLAPKAGTAVLVFTANTAIYSQDTWALTGELNRGGTQQPIYTFRQICGYESARGG